MQGIIDDTLPLDASSDGAGRIARNKDDNRLKVIDLFCGAGGFSEGFKQAGFEIAAAVDNWDVAIKTHELNHPGTRHFCKDIRDIEIKQLGHADVIIGSPPCQGFSIQKFAQTKDAQQKESSELIDAFMNIVKRIRPKYWIWENVPQAKKYADELADAWRLSEVEHISTKIYNASDYNTPQRRKRVFVGSYAEPEKNPYLGEVAPTITAWEMLGGWKTSHGRRFSKWLNRKPTWREMADYMGFPGDYQFYGQGQKDYSIQIGNAVCPPMAKALAMAIAQTSSTEGGEVQGMSEANDCTVTLDGGKKQND